MLKGIRSNEIIVGAYADRGGICPMLAAHRAGGRTSLISFARAWDRFAFRGARVTAPRPATARELLTLKTQLEASLLEDELPEGALAEAIAEHRELMARRRDFSRELRLLERLSGYFVDARPHRRQDTHQAGAARRTRAWV